ncbi:uncharacterized protein BO88DRAFT_58988 [Aspergillus vadensis CBS 113365]|uniref:Uncharacterized protein n=1 Tax=Aspergillus vadensis (strain CBS 113365 / IMI 142717 / IBT 24658) TaxID=1448311 RepID=A0A319B9E2_ASPVC|nr:hypothetical protein BO88DRAFT_58988 [Aspergillus vadensis CBS 113365]PYH68531.1 hypothetical protein BO88DRAFT_58988 [Aspergillus vadensis CBS 113365]
MAGGYNRSSLQANNVIIGDGNPEFATKGLQISRTGLAEGHPSSCPITPVCSLQTGSTRPAGCDRQCHALINDHSNLLDLRTDQVLPFVVRPGHGIGLFVLMEAEQRHY